MDRVFRSLALLALVAGSGCAMPTASSPDAIEHRILKVCAATGLFQVVGDVVKVAYPIAALPLSLVEAGVDQVCANPAAYAQDAHTVEWLIENLGSSTKEN